MTTSSITSKYGTNESLDKGKFGVGKATKKFVGNIANYIIDNLSSDFEVRWGGYPDPSELKPGNEEYPISKNGEIINYDHFEYEGETVLDGTKIFSIYSKVNSRAYYVNGETGKIFPRGGLERTYISDLDSHIYTCTFNGVTTLLGVDSMEIEGKPIQYGVTLDKNGQYVDLFKIIGGGLYLGQSGKDIFGEGIYFKIVLLFDETKGKKTVIVDHNGFEMFTIPTEIRGNASSHIDKGFINDDGQPVIFFRSDTLGGDFCLVEYKILSFESEEFKHHKMCYEEMPAEKRSLNLKKYMKKKDSKVVYFKPKRSFK